MQIKVATRSAVRAIAPMATYVFLAAPIETSSSELLRIATSTIEQRAREAAGIPDRGPLFIEPTGERVSRSRVLMNARPKDETAPFALVTQGSGAGYYFKLVDAVTGKTVFAGLVPVEGRYEFKVPLGVYWLRYATGPGWLDEAQRFGAKTYYQEGDSKLVFARRDGRVVGVEVQLILQTNGNFSSSSVPASKF